MYVCMKMTPQRKRGKKGVSRKTINSKKTFNKFIEPVKRTE